MDYYLKVTAEAKDEYEGGEGFAPQDSGAVARRLADRVRDITRHDWEMPWKVTAVTGFIPVSAEVASSPVPPHPGAETVADVFPASRILPSGAGVRLGQLTRLTRHDLRHSLQELHSQALEVRQAVAHDSLSADGLIADLDRMAATLVMHRERVISEVVRARQEKSGG